jgi:hypothetical protein
MYSIPCCS